MHTDSEKPLHQDGPPLFLRQFRHKLFVEGQSMHVTFASWLSRPLMFCMLPVMITALFLSLEGALISTFLKIGIPIAVLLAAGWALYQMTTTPAEVSFRNDRVLIKTFHDAALKSHIERWHHIIDTRQIKRPPAPAITTATHGHTKFEFRENDWEDYNLLTERLFEANRLYNLKVTDAISA